jgi:hypothetical protein
MVTNTAVTLRSQPGVHGAQRDAAGRVHLGARLRVSGTAGRLECERDRLGHHRRVAGSMARLLGGGPWRAAYSVAATRRPFQAGGMRFFDDLPAPEPAPPRRHHPWEPPEAELPGIVPIDTLLLGRTDQVAMAVTGLSACCAGIEIFLSARIRRSSGHPEEHLPGGPRDLAASRHSFRSGLQFSDRGKAAGSPGGGTPEHDAEPAGPVLYPFAGGGGPYSFIAGGGRGRCAGRAAGVRLRVAGIRRCRTPGRHRSAAYPRRGTAQRPAMAGKRRLTARPYR